LSELRHLRHSSVASVLLMLTGVAVIVGSLYYSVTRLEPLQRQIDEKQGALAKLEDEIKEKRASLDQMEKEIQVKRKFLGVISTSIGVPAESASTTAFERRGNTNLEYFLKDVDQEKVLNAIKDLGFNAKSTAPVGNTPTNAIWFGSQVDI